MSGVSPDCNELTDIVGGIRPRDFSEMPYLSDKSLGLIPPSKGNE